MSDSVRRQHPAETGDSQVDPCPTCAGAGKYPATHQRAGQACDTCAGSGYLLRQRRDSNGNPTRVLLVDGDDTVAADKRASSASGARGNK